MKFKSNIDPVQQLFVDAFIMLLISEVGTKEKAKKYLDENFQRLCHHSMIEVRDSYLFLKEVFRSLKHFHTIEPSGIKN